MGMFDEYQGQIKAIFSDWIKINDKNSGCGWTIEDFPYKTGVDENLTDPHCWKCVTVNQCWFKNEEEKKPEEFNYSKYSLIKIPKEIRDLYHPNCHCQKFELKSPNAQDIKFIMLQGKIDYFFKDKLNWYYSCGYKDEDRENFIKLIQNLVSQSFANGNYECGLHTKYGYQINVFITLPSKNEKLGHYYETWSCYMISPNGKLKLNTVIEEEKNEILR